MNKLKHAVVATAAALGPVALLAEGEAPALDATLFTGQITTANGQVASLLAAGAVIVGSFFIWRVLKKAFNAAK